MAYHLLNASIQTAMQNDLLEPFQVDSRTLDGLHPEAEFSIIAVSDSAIPEVIANLPEMEGIVAHTSGSTPISVFEGSGITRYGVFYPLQTFSKSKPLEYRKIPFYVEGADEDTIARLFALASLFSPHVYPADSCQRKALHIAGVLSCNFVNHLWTLSADFLAENGLNFADLLPLIEETLDKVKSLPPHEAQTGPAVRGDSTILDSHLEILKEQPQLQEIYCLLSDSIHNRHYNR